MAITLIPDSPEAFKDAVWEDILPHFQALLERPLTAANVEQWLADWSRLESLIQEAGARASFAYTCDTTDPAKEALQLRFGMQVYPKAQEQRVKLQERLVELGYTRPDLDTTIQRFRNQMELFRDTNVPLNAELSKLSTEWSKINGRMTVQWDGEEKTPAQLLPFLMDTDRDVRERAFKTRAKPYLETRDQVAGIFDGMYDLRQKIAANAGFRNYRDYVHQEKNRFDYTPDDCLRWHEAVESAVLPAVARILDRRRKELGLDKLRPWDVAVDPHGRAALKPFTEVRTLIDHSAHVFQQVDPAFAKYYKRMDQANLLDLDNRKGKAPGGYCNTLSFSKLPLIFMNAVGVDGDVRTMLHEAGHAFHSFEASAQPLVFQRHPGHEMAEVASMSMELLSSPFIGKSNGGFYDEEDAKRSNIELLEGIVMFFPHCASVDAFQHWIYLNKEGRDADARDAKWLEIRTRFERDTIDWSGLERERIARWYQQPHFFGSPFYYIEYGIAQLGALQVWRNSLRDPKEAVRKYREALALGATKPLPELFKAAGARMIFDAPGMKELVSVVEEQLDKLY